MVAGAPKIDAPVELGCCGIKDPKIFDVELTGFALKLDADGSVGSVVLIVAEEFAVAPKTSEFDPITDEEFVA